MSGPVIHFPKPEEEKAYVDAFFSKMKAERRERQEFAENAFPALERLVSAMSAKTGQGYKLRALLFSLWSGKPAELNEVLCLDWSLRKDFAAVVLGWGYENAEIAFFYDAMISELASRGLVDWFKQEADKGGVS